MSEPTISLSFADLYAEVADYLGYGRSPAGDKLAEVKRYANEGQARFLLGMDPRTHRAYTWSFLAPEATIVLWSSVAVSAITVSGTVSGGSTDLTAGGDSFHTSMVGHDITVTDVGTFTITGYASATQVTVSGDATCSGKTFSISADGTYSLADDFALLVDDFHYTGGAGLGGVRPATVQEIRAMRSGAAATGRPQWYAVQPRSFDPATGQRWEVLVYPTPGADLAAYYRYRVNPDQMVNDTDFPLGGAVHGQAILQCALAVAEERRNDGQTFHQDRAGQLLSASIDLDARNKPRNLGPNADGSGVAGARRGTVTYS